MRTRLGCVPLTHDRKFFPIAQTYVLEHRHKLVKYPIIIHQAVKGLVLLLLFLHDHLPLGKVANHHNPFSQSVSDEMRCLVQAVLLFVALVKISILKARCKSWRVI